MITVKSSQISAIGYDAATQRLQIRFTPKPGEAQGPLYQYYSVPPEIAEAFRTSKSHGSYFIHTIKGDPARFPYVKLDPVTPKEAVRSIAHLSNAVDIADYMEAMPDLIVGDVTVQRVVKDRLADLPPEAESA